MSFFQRIVEFFQSLFMASSPDVKKRQALRKIEADLSTIAPNLYKAGSVEKNFLEALRLLYIHTKSIHDLLSETICTPDIERNMRFTEQLQLSGLPSELQDVLENLDFEKRKSLAREADSQERFFESEHRQLEKVLKYISSPDFVRMDGVLNQIRQLYDISNFSYIPVLRLSDNLFMPTEGYQPQFQPVAVELMESSLLDLYHVCANMDITVSLRNAIVALGQLYNREKYSGEGEEAISSDLKKIQGLLHRVFNQNILQALIRIAKKDASFEPTKAAYNDNACEKYAAYLDDRFKVDSARLKTELQNETISDELKQIFGDTRLAPISGYNDELNEQLKQSPVSFIYVMPLQILKSFLQMYYTEHTKPLLNDIAIEGYFTNVAYKSEFSSDVYALNESLDRIKKFEERFQRNGDFDESLIQSLVHDSHKDSALMNRLKDTVNKINKAAKNLIQTEVNNAFRVYTIAGEVLVESKKANSDIINNLKVLTLSSRNRDNSELLEKQYPLWTTFLEIMKNYVIINTPEKK